MKRNVFVTILLIFVLVLTISMPMVAQQDLSSSRGLGIGARVNLLPLFSVPWPFLSIAFSERLLSSVSGVVLPGVLVIGGALEYRLLNGAALDVLPFVSLVASILNGSFSPDIGTGLIVEYSMSRRLAVQASVAIGLSLIPSAQLSFIYYF